MIGEKHFRFNMMWRASVRDDHCMPPGNGNKGQAADITKLKLKLFHRTGFQHHLIVGTFRQSDYRRRLTRSPLCNSQHAVWIRNSSRNPFFWRPEKYRSSGTGGHRSSGLTPLDKERLAHPFP